MQLIISDIENKNAIPKFDVVIALSKALGVSTDGLINGMSKANEENEKYELDPFMLKAAWLMEQIPKQYREYAVSVLEDILKIIQQKE